MKKNCLNCHFMNIKGITRDKEPFTESVPEERRKIEIFLNERNLIIENRPWHFVCSKGRWAYNSYKTDEEMKNDISKTKRKKCVFFLPSASGANNDSVTESQKMINEHNDRRFTKVTAIIAIMAFQK